MENLDGLDMGFSTEITELEARERSVRRCVKALVHACRCRVPGCLLPSCLKMKLVMSHFEVCRPRIAGDECVTCTQMLALCCYHVLLCRGIRCRVPFCSPLKEPVMFAWQRRRLAEMDSLPQQPNDQLLHQNELSPCLVQQCTETQPGTIQSEQLQQSLTIPSPISLEPSIGDTDQPPDFGVCGAVDELQLEALPSGRGGRGGRGGVQRSRRGRRGGRRGRRGRGASRK